MDAKAPALVAFLAGAGITAATDPAQYLETGGDPRERLCGAIEVAAVPLDLMALEGHVPPRHYEVYDRVTTGLGVAYQVDCGEQPATPEEAEAIVSAEDCKTAAREKLRQAGLKPSSREFRQRFRQEKAQCAG